MSRRLAAICLVGLCAPLIWLATSPAFGASLTTSTLSLSSESFWANPDKPLELNVAVRSPDMPRRLSLKLSLYSRSTSTSGFEHSLTNGQLAGEVPLATTGSIQLHVAPARPNGTDTIVHLKIPISPTAAGATSTKSLNLSCARSYCDGVYPVQIALIDNLHGTPLAEFVTHVVYVTQPSDVTPLNVALVVPIGERPTLGPLGKSALSASQITTLQDDIAVLRAHQDVGLSIDLYAELLVALSQKAANPTTTEILAELHSLASPAAPNQLEFLRSPFVPVDLGAIDPSAQLSELRAQLDRAAATIRSVLQVEPSTSAEYVPAGSLDAGALGAISASGFNRLVLDENQVSIAPYSLTESAPAVLESSAPLKTGSAPTIFVNDSAIANAFAANSNQPVLEAHRVIDELAQIYFEQPALTERGIVVAPRNWSGNPQFLSTLLNGLRALPLLQPATISYLFDHVPIGANDNPTSARLVETSNARPSLTASAIARANSQRSIVRSIVPDDTGLRIGLADALLTAESPLSPEMRARYLGAPARALRELSASVSVSSNRAITLTSRNGKLPVTIRATGFRPIHALLRLSSADLEFPHNSAVTALVLTQRNTTRLIDLSTRTSGSFSLRLLLVSPRGNLVLAQTRFRVHSTAISVVAIVLSAAALGVLIAWWARSVRRNRRHKRHVAPAEASGA
jgi:hypothetical protein